MHNVGFGLLIKFIYANACYLVSKLQTIKYLSLLSIGFETLYHVFVQILGSSFP